MGKHIFYTTLLFVVQLVCTTHLYSANIQMMKVGSSLQHWHLTSGLLTIETTEVGQIDVTSNNKTQSIESFLTTLLNDKPEEGCIQLFLEGTYSFHDLENVIHQSKFTESIHIQTPSETLLTAQMCRDKAVKVLLVTSKSFVNVKTESLYKQTKVSNLLPVIQNNQVLVVTPFFSDTLSLETQCYDLWNRMGKQPDVILSSSHSESKCTYVVTKLQNTYRFSGRIIFKDSVLNEIYWNQPAGAITSGRFTFPLRQHTKTFLPYKNGFHISPSEIIHNTSMREKERTFVATHADLQKQLKYYFPFSKKGINKANPNWKGIFANQVTYLNDKERGQVASFDETNAFIDYSRENTLDFTTPITVAAWIKPDRIAPYMGILGFGTSFSVKLKEGCLDFTTATILDHVSEQALPIKKWSHIAIVYNPNFTVEFYLNGEKIGEQPTSHINPSTHSLMIGNNVWGEQYYGSIDDIRIWNRGLAPCEIQSISLQKEEKNTFYWVLFTTLLLVTLIVFGIIYKLYPKRQNKNLLFKTMPREQTITQKTIRKQKISTNQIRLFGNFVVNSTKEGEISHRFSPLLRRLLSYLLLQWLEQGETGVRVDRMTSVFWPEGNKERSKDNRNKSMKKLRKALEGFDGLKLHYENKKWHVHYSNQIDIDVVRFAQLSASLNDQIEQGKMNSYDVEQWIEILRYGNLLRNLEEIWIDQMKSNYLDRVTTLTFQILIVEQRNSRRQWIEKLARTVLLFDTLNEEALFVLIQHLSVHGKHGQARKEYEKFATEYKTLYSTSFDVNYLSIVDELECSQNKNRQQSPQ